MGDLVGLAGCVFAGPEPVAATLDRAKWISMVDEGVVDFHMHDRS